MPRRESAPLDRRRDDPDHGHPGRGAGSTALGIGPRRPARASWTRPIPMARRRCLLRLSRRTTSRRSPRCRSWPGVTQRPKLGVSVLVVPHASRSSRPSSGPPSTRCPAVARFLALATVGCGRSSPRLALTPSSGVARRSTKRSRSIEGSSPSVATSSFEGEVYRFGPIRVGPETRLSPAACRSGSAVTSPGLSAAPPSWATAGRRPGSPEPSWPPAATISRGCFRATATGPGEVLLGGRHVGLGARHQAQPARLTSLTWSGQRPRWPSGCGPTGRGRRAPAAPAPAERFLRGVARSDRVFRP